MGIFRKKADDTEVEEEEEVLLQDHTVEYEDSDLDNYEIGLRSLPYSRVLEQCLPFDDSSLKRLIPGCELRLTIQDVSIEDDKCWRVSPSRVFKQFLPFDDSSLKRLIPGCELRLTIQDVSIEDDKCWYTLDLEHGSFTWSLKKRFRDFYQLHHHLKVYRALMAIKLPEIKFERNSSRRKSSSLAFRNAKTPKVPTFPITSDILTKKKDIKWNMAALESYLQNVLNISKFRNFQETLEFLEIGPLSFLEDLGPKAKEGFVSRRWDREDGCCSRICRFRFCPSWKKRWLFIKENFVGLLNPKSGQVDTVLLLDHAFSVSRGKHRTGRKDSIKIKNLNRSLYLKCENEAEAELWAIEFEFILDRLSKDFVRPNPYGSFAPPRPSSECKWIIDGATYFEAVAEALEKAKEEIYIADWWLTPEIYLKRPTVHGHYWQLDYVLKRKAMAGVKVYVLLYRELEMALGINSNHSQQKLQRMHKNIKVLRHPEVSKGVFLWAHHEKIVCVDQTYAFVGGIDLCYGRWDDYQHRLSDFGDVETKLKILRHMSTVNQETVVPLEMRSSKSFPDLNTDTSEKRKRNGSEKEVEKEVEPVVKTLRFKTAVRKAQAAQVFQNIKRRLSVEAKTQVLSSDKDITFEPAQPADRRRTIQEMALTVLGMDRKFRLWHGKDYANFITKDFHHLDQPYSDNIDRNVTPRMPWHDAGLFVQGPAARDIARHFILRWNHAKSEICPSDAAHPFLMPKAYANFGDNVASLLHDTIGTIHRAECQVLRSLSFWSGRITETECSIHEAYIDVIRESKHFIYIENQFFITQPSGENNVSNGIADALFNRIVKAHRNNTPFHVYVVLPLLPAFEGELGTGSGTCIQAISHWNYKSICRGPTSLCKRLARQVEDPSVYISFYGLRTHGFLHNKLLTELVYVHSKLLVADDQVAIIGSANINDRSLMGRRDSEIAVVVRDTQFLGAQEGRPHRAGRFCHSMRNAIFREHLGLMKGSSPYADLRDPSSEFFAKEVWLKTAKNNTDIYEEVFRCLPSDAVHDFRQMKNYLSEPCLASIHPKEAKEKLKKIRGYLVVFPFDFLSEVNFATTFSAKEHYLPASVWT